MSNRAFFQQTLSQEFDRFHNVVAALPADRLDYRHDPKSRSAGELVGHLIGHFQDLVELFDAAVIHHRMQVPFDGLPAGLKALDESVKAAEARVANLGDGDWEKVGDFRLGDQSIMKAPVQALAWMLLFDGIHHRGQLSTCIRPMGGKVPGIYGPSADTQPGA